MRLLILLTVAAFCNGLQGPLHYKYSYEGRVLSGIPEVGNEAAVVAIKAKVEIYVEKNDGIAVFQLHDVKVADYHADIGCDFKGELDASKFNDIHAEDLKKSIEAPFKVDLFQHTDFAIEFIDDEFLWMGNVRKGVVAAFHNEVLRGNIDHQVENSVASAFHDGHTVNVFSVDEETIFGTCRVDYTVYKMPLQFAGKRNLEERSVMVKDVQYIQSLQLINKPGTKTKRPSKTSKKYRGKTSTKTSGGYTRGCETKVPDLKQDLWHVTRSVDFDHCEELVSVQTMPIFHHDDVGKSQSKGARSRSSVSEYLMRGSPGAARIERVFVDGVTTMVPYGIKSSLMRVHVQQSLQLESVDCGAKKVPALPARCARSNTLMYEVWSPAATPKHSKNHLWVNYNTKMDKYLNADLIGVKRNRDFEAVKTNINTMVTKAALVWADTEQEQTHSATHEILGLKTAKELFKLLPKEEILKVFDSFFSKDLYQSDTLASKLIVDVAAASGSEDAYKAILALIKDDRLSSLQIMTILATIPNNAVSPRSINPLLDYAVSLNMKEKPFVSSMAIINVAGLIGVMCVPSHGREAHFAGELYGDEGCDTKHIVDTFIPYLRNLIYDENTTWEKDVAIRAFTALQTPFMFEVLAPVIEGTVKCSKHVRANAIYALEGYKLLSYRHLKDQVLDLLTDVYSDIGEDVNLRIAAVSMAASWYPKASFWHRLAHSTWREPSKHFASYVTSFIKSYASFDHPDFEVQNNAATHCVSFMKPVTPSERYSADISHSTYLADLHFFKFQKWGWTSTDEGFNPKEYFLFLLSEYNGFKLVNLEFSGAINNVFTKLQDKFKQEQEKEGPGGIAAKIAADFYNRVQDTIQAQTVPEKHADDTASTYTRFVDNMRVYLPLASENIASTKLFEPTKMAELYIQLQQGYSLVLGKFASLFELQSHYPTELGLLFSTEQSLVVSLTEPSVSTLNLQYGLKSTSLDNAQYKADYVTNFASAATTKAGVTMPWNGRQSVVGVESVRGIVVPLHVNLKREVTKKDNGKAETTTLEFSSLYKKKYTTILARNFPILMTTPTHLAEKEVTIIGMNKVKTSVMPIPGKYSGIDTTVTWISENSFPLSFLNLLQFARSGQNMENTPWLNYVLLSRTPKYWSLRIEIDPETSETEKVRIAYHSATYGKTEPFVGGQETQTSQKGQETGDYLYDYGQSTGGQDQQGFSEFGGEAEVEIVGGAGKHFQTRAEKLQEEVGAQTYTRGLTVDFIGSENRSYSLSYTYFHTKSNSGRALKKSEIAFVRGPIPHVDEKSARICLDTQKLTPAFTRLDTVDSLLEENLDKETKLELTLGCTGTPIMTARGTYSMSEPWKQKLRTALQHGCDTEATTPLYNFHSKAAYDKMNYVVDWQRVCDKKHYLLTSGVMTLFDKVTDLRLGKGDCEAVDLETKLNLDLQRDEKSENWYLKASRGSADAYIQAIPHCPLAEYWFAIGHREEGASDHTDSHTSTGFSSEKCYIGTESVRTFDGNTFEYQPSQCWTVAAKDCSVEKGAMLLVRSGKGESPIPDFKFINVEKGVVIVYSDRVLKVNGKEINPIDNKEIVRDDAGNAVVSIYKKGDYYMAKFSKDFYIAAKETIQIHVPNSLYGKTCGLCGDFNGEPEGEFIGPHRCFYEDPKLFTAAWTAGSDTCDLYSLGALRQGAEDFQKNTCPKYDVFHFACPHFNHRCATLAYIVRKRGDFETCVSQQPIPHCNRDCPIYRQESQKVAFLCWPNEKAPSHLKAALANGEEYTIMPNSAEHYSLFYEALTVPTSCKQY